MKFSTNVSLGKGELLLLKDGIVNLNNCIFSLEDGAVIIVATNYYRRKQALKTVEKFLFPKGLRK